METIFTFLLKVSSGIVLFYIVYWLFLRKETFYTANRWFLITALLTAVLLPFFPVQYSVLVEPENSKTVFKSISDTFKNIPVVSQTDLTTTGFSWQQSVLLVYLTGAAIFLLRLLSQTFILIHLMIKYRIKSMDGIRIVENEKYGLPFSFFNIVFINPKFHTQADLPEILAHEKVHIREFHWFDLLFIELLTVIFWFNPFIWFFERSIKQNHEYLADKGVLAQGHGVGRYQALLINQLMGMQIIGITNNLNFALNTNRLKMMTKKKTSRWIGIKFAWVLPAIALLLFAFAEPNYQLKKVNEYDSETLQKKASDKTVKLAGTIVDENGEPLPGAAIVIKGGTVGTVCDIDGKFNLNVPENEAIVLSFVGKKTFVDTFEGIISENKKDGAYHRKYQMKDDIIGIGLAEKLIPLKELIPPPPPPPPAPIANGDKEVFYIVEDMPVYPGGSGALNNYVYKMQQKLAQANGIKGKAKVAFTVNGKGKVSDIKIVEKDNDGAGKGAVSIVSGMEDWTPGKQRGKSVPVKYLLPVEFK
jgi:beta-lactamase regulating signal transducer with metallopeptidase domain